MNTLGLVADVGGTNIRLASVDLKTGAIGSVRSYLCTDYPTIITVLEEFLKHVKAPIRHACIAVACPVDNDWVELTNNKWRFSVTDLRKLLGFQSLEMINDYTAIAMAVPKLKANQKIQIGRGEAIPGKPIAVCGPGTGLGVAFLKCHNDQWVCLDGEGGHVDFAPQSDFEDFILEKARQQYSHVSAERFITGPGLVNIYRGIKSYYDENPEDLDPKEITRRAIAGQDPRCREVLDLFCRMLGAFAGNLAITVWAAGGVYIAGGIAPNLVNYIAESNFRARFESKGRFTEHMKKIPTYVITDSQPGIIGAAAYLTQKEGRP
jgi:glucokinase